ncbi:hypothetical protein B0H16DRAFT_1891791 [Mycena metata]|uniref:Uncharacterized protein n=1 Tax=Mycena metata TaxID=1033252 RepID=A0AAD7I7K0_9AGAR|nr:hypothetical protein B0H16DRAFT_1891791 [Mycena metata]
MTHHAQREANNLRNLLEHVQEHGLPDSLIPWPAIDYNEVSTPTCTAVLALLQAGHAAPTAPETPERVRVAREIDYVLAKRDYLVKQRVCDAQRLEALIKEHLPTILHPLQAARRSGDEQSLFPDVNKDKIVESLHALRRAMNAVEDMVRSSTDLGNIEATMDAGDVDTTLVEMKDLDLS